MMTAKRMLPFLVWFLLLSFPIAAQEIDENITEEQQRLQELQENQAAADEVVNQRIIRSIFEKDINASSMILLTQSIGPSLDRTSNKIREELGITKEQGERVGDLMYSAMQENGDFGKYEKTIGDRLVTRAANGDLYLTKEEDEQIDVIVNDIFEAMESTAAEVFTEEQRKKTDGMLLTLTGGLESPFFSERHMAAIDMTDEQKRKFAAINEELKPERDKMIAEFSKAMGGIQNKDGKLSVQELINTLSTFKSYGKKIKKRRSEVLTSEQIAKAMKLSKLPKALSLSHLLPKWAPSADSWKPGDPLPEGLVPNNPQPAPRFPIGEQY